jgi:uncharacterized phage protein (TIGR02220 family)
MAASVRIEDEAFSDERYEDLAAAAGLADADHARGKMLRIWRQCTIEQTHKLARATVVRILGVNGPSALETARLGEVDGDLVRIRGTRGRIEWLKKLRDNGKFGKRGAQHGARGGRPRKNTLQGVTENPLVGVSENPPPAPAPAPAPAHKEEEDLSGKPDPAAELAEVACSEINRLARTRYRPDSDSVRKLCRALIKAHRTPEQIRRVIAAKRAWLDDAKMRPFFRPATLLADRNFATYLDELEAAPASQRPLRQSEDRPHARSPLMLALDQEGPDAAA